jgi:hypothetical protein
MHLVSSLDTEEFLFSLCLLGAQLDKHLFETVLPQAVVLYVEVLFICVYFSEDGFQFVAQLLWKLKLASLFFERQIWQVFP